MFIIPQNVFIKKPVHAEFGWYYDDFCGYVMIMVEVRVFGHNYVQQYNLCSKLPLNAICILEFYDDI